MKYRVHRRGFLKGAAGLAGLSLLGCTAPTTGTTTGGTTAPTGPKIGGSLTMGGIASTNLDPHRMTGPSDLWMSGMGYNQIVRWLKDPDKGFGPEPELAESWEMAPDGLSAVLKIRRGVKFQNVAPVNGRELTVEDIKWNLERFTSNQPYFARRAVWEPLSSVAVVDPATLKLTFKRPWPDFLIQLGYPTLRMLAKEAVEAAGDDNKFNADPKFQIGTGPLILADYRRDVGAKYRKNPDYFKPGRPYVDEVNVRWFAEQTPRFAALRGGETADMGWFLSATQYQILKSSPGIVTTERPGTSWNGVMFNLRVKPFDDVRVRRAVALAIDADAQVKGAWGNGAIASRTAIPVAFKEEALPSSEWPKFDPNRAKQLLTEAGLPNGFKFTLMATGNNEESKLGAELIKEALAKIGIDVTLDLPDFPDFIRRATAKEFEANLIRSWAGDVVTSSFFDSFFTSTAPRNYFGYANPQFDQTVQELNRTFEPAKRRDLAHRAQRILIEDMPVAHLVVPIDFYAWHNWFKGYSTNWLPGSMTSYVDEFWVDR